MNKPKNTYRFKSKILPDGHLSAPEEIGANTGKEFEVTITPVDDIKNSVSLYFEGRLKRNGRITDISFDSEEIEEAVKTAFDTNDVDAIINSVRR
jgi:hypothetical protein